ncbi:uncharacterized protein B0H18DRAFT_1011443 [Fomitopsis serialis]|uniref:uncharacterized protein n=1 Tax=Fomitopsis serialis TaxID=139415 RepID=UPI002008D571|nr:uncharacterized protein B0H18DRAFT_1011443 [Neoantrodia serialis]KAH9924817.1 hypothetical protein B0H18DRAFT_1011443 [Neoantrodia serialis]
MWAPHAQMHTTTMALFFPLATVLSHVRAVLGLPRTSSATNGAKVYYVSDYEEILTHETALHLRSGAATPGLLFFIPLTDNHYVFFGVTRHTVYDQLVIALSHTVKVSLNEPELTICWVNNAAGVLHKAKMPTAASFWSLAGRCFSENDKDARPQSNKPFWRTFCNACVVLLLCSTTGYLLWVVAGYFL